MASEAGKFGIYCRTAFSKSAAPGRDEGWFVCSQRGFHAPPLPQYNPSEQEEVEEKQAGQGFQVPTLPPGEY